MTSTEETVVSTDISQVLRIKSETDTLLNLHHAVTIPFAEKIVRVLLNKAGPVLGCDIETAKKSGFDDNPQAGLLPYLSKISLIQFYDEVTNGCYSVDLFSVPLEILEPVLRSKRLVFHNAIFDQQHLAYLGYKNLKVDCTMIMYQMWRVAKFGSVEEELDFVSSSSSEEGDGSILDWMLQKDKNGVSLSAITGKLFNIRISKVLQTSNWGLRPLTLKQIHYAAADPYYTYKIAKEISPQIVSLGLEKVYKLNRSVIHPVVEMILNGSTLDAEKHKKQCELWVIEKDKVDTKLRKKFGKNLNSLRSLPQLSKWFNNNLPAELQHHWPRSEKTSLYRMDAKTLSQFATRFDYVRDLLEFKKLDKMLSTYGLTLIDKICPVTNRLHGSFTIGYTATNRLSSRNPNLQNLPRDTSIRSIFIAEPGHLLIGADYSQIELRVAALLSGDKRMLDAFEKGIDLHSYLASKILGKGISKVTKEDRNLSKSLSFGLIYGLGAKGLKEYAAWNFGVVLTDLEAREYYNKFFATWEGYALWQVKMRKEAEENKYTSTVLGKKRFLAKGKTYTRAVNHPVQGSSAEVVLRALVRLYKEVGCKYNFKMINCIHDEILLSVPEEHVESACRTLKRVMEKAMLDIFPKATLNGLIDVKVGKNWAELK